MQWENESEKWIEFKGSRKKEIDENVEQVEK